MARRRRRVALAASGIPEALTSVEHDLWKSTGEAAALFQAHGFDMPDLTLPYWDLFALFRRQYCAAMGLNRDRYPEHMDLERARSAGIDTVPTVRYRYVVTEV